MPANGHVQLSPNSTAIVEVNTLSEDAQAINPADHDGISSKVFFFLFSQFV